MTGANGIFRGTFAALDSGRFAEVEVVDGEYVESHQVWAGDGQ